jgi:hypothetical protein
MRSEIHGCCLRWASRAPRPTRAVTPSPFQGRGWGRGLVRAGAPHNSPPRPPTQKRPGSKPIGSLPGRATQAELHALPLANDTAPISRDLLPWNRCGEYSHCLRSDVVHSLHTTSFHRCGAYHEAAPASRGNQRALAPCPLPPRSNGRLTNANKCSMLQSRHLHGRAGRVRSGCPPSPIRLRHGQPGSAGISAGARCRGKIHQRSEEAHRDE